MFSSSPICNNVFVHRFQATARKSSIKPTFFERFSLILAKRFYPIECGIEENCFGFFLIFQNKRHPTVFTQSPANQQSSRHFLNVSSCFLRNGFYPIECVIKANCFCFFLIFQNSRPKNCQVASSSVIVPFRFLPFSSAPICHERPALVTLENQCIIFLTSGASGLQLPVSEKRLR